MAVRDKIEHAIQNQPCTVKDLKSKFGGDRGSDRKVMEAVDQLVHEAVICQRQNVLVHGDAPPFCYSPRHRKRAMSTVPLARKATPSASSSVCCSGQWGAVRPARFTTR